MEEDQISEIIEHIEERGMEVEILSDEENEFVEVGLEMEDASECCVCLQGRVRNSLMFFYKLNSRVKLFFYHVDIL